ncbi:MAG: PEP-CTERM sorting domain-containing protein [Fimbriimonadaceae bacterium]|nr:PEP-CTERM sorting domain-containing protein [Fimbriimonadaceae bacterium]
MKKLCAVFVVMAAGLGWLTWWSSTPAELGPAAGFRFTHEAAVSALPAWPSAGPTSSPSGAGPAADSVAVIQSTQPEPSTYFVAQAIAPPTSLASDAQPTDGQLVAGWASALSGVALRIHTQADLGAVQPVSRPSRWSASSAERAPQRRQHGAPAGAAQPRRAPAAPPRDGTFASFRVAKSLVDPPASRWNDWRDPENPVVANVRPAPSDVQPVVETPSTSEVDPYAMVLRDRVKQAIEPSMETSLEQAQDPAWEGGTGGFEPLEVADADAEQNASGAAAPQLFRQPGVTRSIPGVPEPSSTLLLLSGTLGLCGYRRRRARA